MKFDRNGCDWRDGVRQVQAEAAGVLELDVVRPSDIPSVLSAARAGDAEAVTLLIAVRDSLDRIGRAPAAQRMECATCGGALIGISFAVVIARPSAAHATTGLGLAICAGCGPDMRAIRARAVDALRAIWPDGRAVQVAHAAGGRA